MPNAFTNFLRNKKVKNIAGEWTKKTADALDAFNDPSERKITINDIKLVSPENFIKRHNCIQDIQSNISDKNKIHYGTASPIQSKESIEEQRRKKVNFVDNCFYKLKNLLPNYEQDDTENIIEHTIKIITNFLSETYTNIENYYSKKTILETNYNEAKKIYKENKQYFNIIKSLPISKIEDVNLLLEKNSFSEASNTLNATELTDSKKNAIENLEKALNICLKELQKCDQLKISENNNMFTEIKVLISEIDSTKVLSDQESDLKAYTEIENSERKCSELLHFLANKIHVLNKTKKALKSQKKYKENIIFFEKTLPTLYKFYTDKLNKLNKNYKSGSGIFSKFKDSVKFRDIIKMVSEVKFTDTPNTNNSKETIIQITGSINKSKIDNYKCDVKLPKLYAKYQDSYNFLFGNKNKYTGKYKKLSPSNMSKTYDVSTHTKWSNFKMNSNIIKTIFEEYLYRKNIFLDNFEICNDLLDKLKLNFNNLIKYKNTILMVKYRLPCFGVKETQKIINISLKGLNRYGKQNHIHIGYFFAYVYYVYSKLSEKNFELLTKFLGHNSLQTMKSSFDTNNFEDSLLSKLKSKFNIN